MFLGGNPGGIFYASAGAVGLSGSSGSGQVSGMLSGMGGLTSGLAGGSGAGGDTLGNDFPGGLMLVNAVGGTQRRNRFRVDETGINYTIFWESRTGQPNPYVKNGVVGFGHRVLPGEIPPPQPMSVNAAIEQVRTDYRQRVEPFLNQVNVPLNQAQVNALGDWTYNHGGGTFTQYILWALNEGYYGAVANMMARGIGRELPGDVVRNIYDAQMFLSK
jgi:GH24 family phage-related lysozyme (muramidase)